MPASSPYQNNDYQAANSFRPHRLPINDIFKANSAINAFWDMGAERVRDVYQNALNLKLRTTDNINIRDQFMKDSESQLVKLSTMNLADASIQRQGMNIYTPLLRDQDIVGENYVIKTGDKELGVAEQFRTKDGGKNYNPLSVENIQFEQNLLSVDPTRGGLNKRDGWRAIAQSQSKYTPYSDMSKEYKQILDTVKSREMEQAQLAGNDWYINEIKTKGVSKDRIAGAIQEMGSPQLKAQMGVEARNVFYKKMTGDPASVDGYYQNLAASYYDNKIGELQKRKAELEYEAHMTPTDSTDPDIRKSNLERIKVNKEGAEELGKVINQMEFKDKPEFIQGFQGLFDPNNLSSNIAKVEQLWQASSIDNLAGKLAWESKSQDIKANPAKIAQENLQLGYERLQKDYLDLAEDKRHNLADETVDMINALKPPASGKGKKADGSDADDDLENPFAGQPGVLNTTASNSANTETTAAGAQVVRDYLTNKDERLREAGIRNVLGDNAWVRIQEGVSGNKTAGAALLPDELNAAAQMMKAFSNKKVEGGTKLFGVTLPFGATDEQYSQFVSNIPAGTLKMMMGAIMKNDPDFTADLVGKMSGENGVEKAAQFRSEYNKSLRDDINVSENVNTKVAANLGEWANLFPNAGKTVLTDKAIADAWNVGIANNSLRVYNKVWRGGGKKEPITKEQFEAYNAGTLKFDDAYGREETPTLKQFREQVRKRTDYLYNNIKTESNGVEFAYVYNHKNPEKKTSDAVTFMNNIAQSTDSDPIPDLEAMKKYILSNSTDIEARSIGLPGIGKQLPTVRLAMKAPTGKDNIEAYGALVEKINSTNFQMTGLSPTYYRRPGEDGYVRNPGARVVYAPFKSDGANGTVEIVNYSASAASIEPRIKVNGELNFKYKDSLGNKVVKAITPNDINAAFSAKYGNETIQSMIQKQGGIDEVNKWLSGWLTNLEKNNKAYK